MNQPENVTVTPGVRIEQMEYLKVPVLKYTYSYPVFSSRQFMHAVSWINQYYLDRGRNLIAYVKRELLPLAISDYEYSKKTGYPFHMYEVVQTYTVTYNQGYLLSLYLDLYQYTGGAHGSSIQTSDTWNVKHGRILKLADFFPEEVPFAEEIQTEVIRQIDQQMQNPNTAFYFKDYAQLVKKTFNPNNFYLTKDGLSIYYQQYDIAPYFSGIPVFIIPYNTMGITFPEC